MVGSSRELAFSLDTDLSKPIAVGGGQFLHLSGWCYHPRLALRSLAVLVDGIPHELVHRRLARPDVLAARAPQLDAAGHSMESGFWILIPLGRIDGPREARLEIRARLTGGEVQTRSLGTARLVPCLALDPEAAVPLSHAGGAPLVAICMATYNPPLDLLERQLDSIVGQTQRNWICIVNDDGSSQPVYEGIRRLAGRDPRFHVYRNVSRLGFYHNFERCLARVPAGVDFVALSDQDDEWYPDKLSACLAAFEPETQLVYSDMDIVSRDGQILSRTYWTTRRNNYTDLASLLFANTVTGAASVFRAGLLDDALPFPRRIGESYHDHWLACAALVKGSIGYVDRPLYSYRQHSANVLGHHAPPPVRPLPSLSRLLHLARFPTASRRELRARADALNQGFHNDVVRIALMARTLRLRLPGAPGGRGAVLDRIARIDRSAAGLLMEGLKYELLRRPTSGAEWYLLHALLAYRAINAYHRCNRVRIYRRHCLAVKGAIPVDGPGPGGGSRSSPGPP